MSITEKDIHYIADLARITVTDDEASMYAKDFQSILEYVDQLKQVTDGANNAQHEHLVTKVMRDDVVINQSGAYTDAILKNAPDTKDGYFKVKKIL
jgi:aspartyl-tRNA(Asn)/glutamyl-tRNA(Gln) amidotransferase subunit C